MNKENKLKKRKEFNYIFKNGTTNSVKLISLVTTASKLKNFKVGYSISKKIGNAVVRNKVKRRLKNAVLKFEQNITPKTNYIFVARSGIGDATYQQIEEAVREVLIKSGYFVKL